MGKRSANMKRKLLWGETPWDKYRQNDLLKEVWRIYSALNSLYSAVRVATVNDVASYWKQGMGGAALEKAKQILAPLAAKYTEEEIYRAFFRYADDLLFDCSQHQYLGSNWVVCPQCGRAVGDTKAIGEICKVALRFGDCVGIMRPLEWQDLIHAEMEPLMPERSAKRKAPKDVCVKQDDLDFLIWSSTCYCLGRRTYVVWWIEEIIKTHAKYLSANTISGLRHEIDAEIVMAQRDNLLVGNEQDHNRWISIVEFLENLEIKRRKNARA